MKLFERVWSFFLDPFWKGPKPKARTILRLCPMGGQDLNVRISADELGKIR
jgi:hypothetical protein